MSVRDSMNAWGIEYLNTHPTFGADGTVPEGASVRFEDDPGLGCPTCGPDYTVDISARWVNPDTGRTMYRAGTWWGRFNDLITEISEWEETRE